MPSTEWLSAFAAGASAIAASLAWAAKLWWGREYRDAKDEIIRAKDAQIAAVERELASLRDLTPMKVREYFTSVRTQLEEYNDALKAQLGQAREGITARDRRISALEAEGTDRGEELARLRDDKARLESAAVRLDQRIGEATSLNTQLKKATEEVTASEEMLARRGVPGDNPADIARYLGAELSSQLYSLGSTNTLYEIACVLFYGTKAEAVRMLSEKIKMTEKEAHDILTSVNVTRFRNELMRSDRGDL